MTNQSEGARNWTNQRRVSVDQSEPSSQNAMRGTDGIKGTVPSLLPFPSITQSRNDVYLCMKLRRETKTRLPRFVTTPQVTISEAATQGYSTVAPPSGKRKSQDTVQQQQQHSLCVYIPVATAEKYFHPIQTYDNI